MYATADLFLSQTFILTQLSFSPFRNVVCANECRMPIKCVIIGTGGDPSFTQSPAKQEGAVDLHVTPSQTAAMP